MSYLQICRLVLGPPPQWHEAVGDPITNLGGAAIPAPRQALRHQITVATYAGDGLTDTLVARLTLRRQLRSMLNNTPLKLQGYFYVIYSDDPDQNGWYTPDFGQLTDIDGAAGLATGVWKLEQVAWIMAGHRRFNREARNIWMKDLRTGLNARDFLRLIYSTDFSALPALQLTPFPHGATSIANAVNGQVATTFPFLAGRDGGIAQVAIGLVDLACVAYDRPDNTWGASDTIVYDRQGANDAPAGGPGPTWVEAYGPDYAWPWAAATPTSADTPVFDNGLVRVRWDATTNTTPGFKVDLWTGAAYAEQGKLTVQRISNLVSNCDTWISASLMEYTPDRAVMLIMLASSSDSSSRERIYITLQRGEISTVFEGYPAPRPDTTPADIAFYWTPALNSGVPDLNTSVAKIDSQGSGSWTPGAAGAAVYRATAGTGAGSGNSGGITGAAQLGAASFATSENWVSFLRCPTTFAGIGPYQTTLIVTRGANANANIWGGDVRAYNVGTNAYQILGQNQSGYLQVQLAFGATTADQVMEAENMTLGAGTTTVVDSSASGTGNNTTQTSRTTDANLHVSRGVWPNGVRGVYRVFARVRSTGAHASFYAKTGATTGATVTLLSPTTPVYQWVDLGEIAANVSTLEIHAWISSGTGIIDVDRIEAVLVQDRLRVGAIYSGARDQAQAALFDSRVEGCVVAK